MCSSDLGDEAELAPIRGDVEVGQICLVRGRDDCYLLHRVVRTAPGRVWTQGDALATGEGPFHPGQVLARVVMVRRRGRAWSPERRSTRMLHALWRPVQPVAARWLRLMWAWRRQTLGGRRAHAAGGSGAASADQS